VIATESGQEADEPTEMYNSRCCTADRKRREALPDDDVEKASDARIAVSCSCAGVPTWDHEQRLGYLPH
jgi:hypothetical protein